MKNLKVNWLIILGGNSRIRLGTAKIFVSEEEYVFKSLVPAKQNSMQSISQSDQWYCRVIEAQVRP